MTSLMFMLMMQFVVSTKAGLVNYVQGNVNVKAMQQVEAGTSIKTGSGGFAEVLLNPGSYLRLGENSEAVLDGVELTNIALRIISGTVVIEAVGFDKETPLRVTSGNLATEIIKDGVFTFSDGKVAIVEGKLQAADNKIVFTKGWQVSKEQTYRAVRIPKGHSAPVEAWSLERSRLMAAANVNVANSLRRSSYATSTFLDCWLLVPGVGAYVFMPGYRFRSPYGYHYRTFVDAGYGRSASGETYEASSGGGGTSNSSSLGGSAGGGGSSSAPVAIESRPIQSQIERGDPPARGGRPGL